MSFIELPDSWPTGEETADSNRLLSKVKTGVFTNKTHHPPTPYVFYVANIAQRTTIMNTITKNGGRTLSSLTPEGADFIIDFGNEHSHSKTNVGTPVCLPKFITECLAANRILDARHYSIERPRSSPSRSGSDIKAPASDLRPIAHNVHAGEDMDIEDRYVDEMLSSQSRSIAEYRGLAVDSPGSQSTFSMAISDSDYRVKRHLDSTSRDISSMSVDEALSRSRSESRIDQSRPIKPLRAASVWRRELPQSPQQPLPTQFSPAPSTSPSLCFENTNRPPKRVALVSSASKSFKAARDFFESSSPVLNGSPTFSQKFLSPVAARSRSVNSSNGNRCGNASGSRSISTGAMSHSKVPPLQLSLLHMDTQMEDQKGLSDLENMESTPPIASSPELMMPESERSALCLSNPDEGPPFQSPGQSVRNTPARKFFDTNTNFNKDMSDDDYPDPAQLLADRRNPPKSMSPELGVSESLPHKTPANSPDDAVQSEADVETNGEEVLEEALALEHELVSTCPKLGKRRRTTHGTEGYDQQALPVVIDKQHNMVISAEPEQTAPSIPGTHQAPTPAPRSHSLDSMITPISRRVRRSSIRGRAWPSAKRIRMSAADSPDISDGITAPLSAPAATANVSASALGDEAGHRSLPQTTFGPRQPAEFTSPTKMPVSEDGQLPMAEQAPVVVASQSSQSPSHPATSQNAPQLLSLGTSNHVTHVSQTPEMPSLPSTFSSERNADSSVVLAALLGNSNPPTPAVSRMSDIQHQEAIAEVDSNAEAEVGSESSHECASKVQSDVESPAPAALAESSEDERCDVEDVGPDADNNASPVPAALAGPSEDEQRDTENKEEAGATDAGDVGDAAVNQVAALGRDGGTAVVEEFDVEKSAYKSGDSKSGASEHTKDAVLQAEETPAEYLSRTTTGSGSVADIESIADSEPQMTEGDANDSSTTTPLKTQSDALGSGLPSPHALGTADKPSEGLSPAHVVDVQAGYAPEESSGSGKLIPKPVVNADGGDWWIEDTEVLLDEHTGRLKRDMRSLSPYASPGMQSQSAISTREFTRLDDSAKRVVRKSDLTAQPQLQPSRQRRISTGRRMSVCERLLELHQASNGGVGNGLGDNEARPSAFEMAPPSAAPSPSRRASISGTIRAFGGGEPEIDDIDRLRYMGRVKGLIEGGSISAKEALQVLYFCTGDWVNARRYIAEGAAAIPEDCLWNAQDDETLLQGLSMRKMKELRERRGNVEVYRRLQFLNTFHGSGT
ncbi:hypothetical protein BX661DRAFT_175827 [Kickxella alabastrina]|uniref:uncharacterized protein n=1 Tax=Kickxella alabastrina TaxID=61397 RepID=UPI002220420A|nr:uncharacterized protein BX661DRAFT_175827 [Kickxella alabastrina]KAI7834949.1 hypothetical protein BX661DRAFT_175827 [Kickxella alabastrina]